MATGTAGSVARTYHQQMVHYLRKGFSFADRLATLTVGVIPSGAVIQYTTSGVYVTQVFNAGTNNLIDIGASSDVGTNNFGTSISLTALGVVPLDEGLNISPMVTADTTVQAYINVTGTTPTTGTGEIIIAYFADNDL
jgi:hypothetical protein